MIRKRSEEGTASQARSYTRYEQGQALQLLRLPRTPVYLGGAFFTDGSASALFATVSRTTQGSHFERVEEFEWRMKPGGRIRRPPDEALGDISLLCRLEEDASFTYLEGTISFRLDNGEVDDIAFARTVKRETAIAVIDRLLAGEDRPDIVRWRRP